MDFSIGQTGGGPREFSEWLLKLPTFVIDRYYGHPVTPFICYETFCKNYGIHNKIGPVNLINTNLNPTEQKKMPIILIPDFTLSKQEIDAIAISSSSISGWRQRASTK